MLGAPWCSQECVVCTLRHGNVKCVDLHPICAFLHEGGEGRGGEGGGSCVH